MGHLIRGTLGEHVPLIINTRKRTLGADDGDLHAVNGVTVQDIIDPDGASVTPIPQFFPRSDGDYIAHLDTTAYTTAGDYEVEILIRHGFDTVDGSSRTTRVDRTVRLSHQGGP